MTDVAAPVKRLSRQEQQERTRRAILDAAIDLFIARGIEATSIEDVVAAAGFTRGAFYSNFESKDDLFIEATRHFFDDVLFAHSRNLEGEPAAAGRETFEDLRNVVDNQGSIYIAEASLYAHRHPKIRAQFVALHEGALQHTMGWVEAALQTYGVTQPPLPVRTLANITQAVTFGLHLKELIDPDVHAADALAGLLAVLLASAPPPAAKPARAARRRGQ
jgi:AcrR family transcriptional regulator